jgi:hypothetical protein
MSVVTTVLRRTNITGYMTPRDMKAFDLFLRETTISALQTSTTAISNYIAEEILTNSSW